MALPGDDSVCRILFWFFWILGIWYIRLVISSSVILSWLLHDLLAPRPGLVAWLLIEDFAFFNQILDRMGERRLQWPCWVILRSSSESSSNYWIRNKWLAVLWLPRTALFDFMYLDDSNDLLSFVNSRMNVAAGEGSSSESLRTVLPLTDSSKSAHKVGFIAIFCIFDRSWLIWRRWLERKSSDGMACGRKLAFLIGDRRLCRGWLKTCLSSWTVSQASLESLQEPTHPMTECRLKPQQIEPRYGGSQSVSLSRWVAAEIVILLIKSTFRRSQQVHDCQTLHGCAVLLISCVLRKKAERELAEATLTESQEF